MRFDYHSPNIRYKSFHLRRFITSNLVFIGLVCILCALFAKNPAPKIAHQETIVAKVEPDLSLEETEAAAQTNEAHTEAILASARDTWQTITVQVGDTISKVFQKLNISSTTLHKIIRATPSKKELANLQPGQKLDFLFDDLKKLKAIKLSLSDTKALHLTDTGAGFKYHYEETRPTKRINFSSAKIKGSLYSSAQSAGLNDRLIMQMAEILGYDIDFSLDIRDNDSFKVLYEQDYIRDKKIDSGRILAVEFNNQGKIYKAVRYTDEKGRDGYYSADGYGLQKAFLRSPVVFTRISSHFSNARRHPILHKMRMHKGVDYAAPQGTPVKAAGDGRISFIGTKGGYGRSIEITHGQKYSTFYAHLCRFNSKLRHGTQVKQGQVIGYVGKTGLATGPHLHYEFRINGIHHNPVTVTLPRSQSIATKNKDRFKMHAENMFTLLNSHSQLAKNE